MFRFMFLILMTVLILPGVSFAEEAAQIDTGDTAWIIVSTIVVMLMTPGLAFFYSGMVRKKNVLATLMHSFFTLCIISVVWVLWGYTLAFGSDVGGIVGSLEFLGLNGVGMEANGTIPHYVFMLFQGMFAVITVALITGGFAERIKFSAVVLFSVLWVTIVYAPLCHWVWGGGWIGEMGALDFAGGTVVHISSGVAALVAALVIGKRRNYPESNQPPHSLGLTVLGGALLWFGWFGFNGGSALAADGVAALAIVTTNTAAGAGAIGWVFGEWIMRGKPTVLGAVSGAVAGLVAITPATGFVTPMAAIIIGLIGGLVCLFSVSVLKRKLGYDDTLDVFGIHCIGGTWGALATGLFASVGAKGLFYGNASQMWPQIVAILGTYVFVAIATFIILKVVDMVTGLRVSDEEEEMGLDISEHGEQGYNL